MNENNRAVAHPCITMLFLSTLLAAAQASVHAQVPPGRQTIDITSSFKPVLRESAKLPFAPTPPRPDTTPPRLSYSIPVSNVIPPLSAFSIRPVERAVDSASSWAVLLYQGYTALLGVPLYHALGLGLGLVAAVAGFAQLLRLGARAR